MVNKKIQKIFLGILLLCSVNNMVAVEFATAAKVGSVALVAGAAGCVSLIYGVSSTEEALKEKEDSKLNPLKVIKGATLLGLSAVGLFVSQIYSDKLIRALIAG